jgi:hypothetical protein
MDRPLRFSREHLKATLLGLAFTVVLAVLIVAGSRNLAHFDAALVGYTFAVLFATFAITYRYSMWLQRPPTALYWRRGWQVFFSPKYLGRNLVMWVKRVVGDMALNSFIFRREKRRGVAHMLIMWGCIMAFAITFPLVFGWIHFETVPGNLERYQVFVFGFPTQQFDIESLVAFVIFHGLVWSAFLVIAGVMLAMRRRMREHSAASVQKFGEDLMPLILLFAISITGLLLTVSYTWMKGYGYEFLAILHAVTVIFTLLWLPFGKFFHIFQRPAQLGVAFYKDIGAIEGLARCQRCDGEFAPQMQVDDLIEVQRKLGYRYEMSNAKTNHYQRICPACRRKMLGLAQGRVWSAEVRD